MTRDKLGADTLQDILDGLCSAEEWYKNLCAAISDITRRDRRAGVDVLIVPDSGNTFHMLFEADIASNAGGAELGRYLDLPIDVDAKKFVIR